MALLPLYSVAQIRTVEQAALRGLAPGTLMERAGAAAAALARRILGSVERKRVLVLAGPGNNGGDAFVAARCLAQSGASCSVLPMYTASRGLPPDASNALRACKATNINFLPAGANPWTKEWDLVVDGLFGIGLRRSMSEPVRATIEAANRLPCPRLALDVPSGLNADTGLPVVEEGRVIVATHTITFLGDKPGLHTGMGRDYCGEVSVASLGVDQALFPVADLHLCGVPAFSAALRPRAHATHKGSFGDVTIIGGAAGMTGAAILAARAALYGGAGRVFAAMLSPLPLDPLHPELMLRDVHEADLSRGVLVAGPGLGTGNGSEASLTRVIASARPLVLDADALNILARDAGLWDQLTQRTSPAILTPHPLEAARLLACSVDEVQRDRVAAARLLARRSACVTLLKGSGTIIAAPGGSALVNPTGNPALATPGSGDVLAGLCGALLAQGYTAWHAAAAGAWMHGRAADSLVEGGSGPIGVTASELAPAIRDVLNKLTSSSTRAFPLRS